MSYSDFKASFKMIRTITIGEGPPRGGRAYVIAQDVRSNEEVFIASRPIMSESSGGRVRTHQQHELLCVDVPPHLNVARLVAVCAGPSHFYIATKYEPYRDLFELLGDRRRETAKNPSYAVGPGKSKALYGFPLDVVKRMFLGILNALRHFSRHGLEYKDVKLENVVGTPDGSVIKLVDLELVTEVGVVAPVMGTVYYLPPELWKRGEGVCDGTHTSWACGVLLYTLITGELPFYSRNMKELVQLVRGRKYEPTGYQCVDETLKRLFRYKPAKRWPIDRVSQLAWLQS
jgi:5'-AMP-activated protein kinase, catalytic alpha subunit